MSPAVEFFLIIALLLFIILFFRARARANKLKQHLDYGNQQYSILDARRAELEQHLDYGNQQYSILDARRAELEQHLDYGNQQYKELQQQLYESKLDGLQIMLNPHSFRNTLNTIQHLAKQTLNSVESLAGIFDYMLYDARQRLVSLEKEVKFANEYLRLYRLRLKPNVKVTTNLEDKANEEFYQRMKIPPMIFAHFIENVFKHGDIESEEAFIHIKLEIILPNQIIYSVRNRISDKKIKQKGGLGYAKLIERLELLYPNNYQLDYKPSGEFFSANLKLTLHEK